MRVALAVTALSLALIALTSSSYAQSESVIYQFDCTNAPQNGCGPTGGVIAKNGALFGTTSGGGTSGAGTVFALRPPSTPSAPWSESVLYSFLGGADGSDPLGGLLAGAGRILYGTTASGGASGFGTAFSLQPPTTPGASWIKTTLYSFAGGSDAAAPETPLIADSSGTLDGSTGSLSLFGGGCGTVYSLTPPAVAGGAWTERVLYSFTCQANVFGPSGGLVMDKSGTLYGFTGSTGFPGVGGVVYSLTPPAVAGGAWTENVLYSFSGLLDGSGPVGTLVLDKSGRLFGAHEFSWGFGGDGSVFQLTPPAISGSGWTEHAVWEFGAWPAANGPLGVILGNDVLYGTTTNGGSGNVGTVFQLTPPTALGSPWTETILHAFSQTSGTDGYLPDSGVVLGPGGALYGTTSSGGSLTDSDGGTVYEVTP